MINEKEERKELQTDGREGEWVRKKSENKGRLGG